MRACGPRAGKAGSGRRSQRSWSAALCSSRTAAQGKKRMQRRTRAAAGSKEGRRGPVTGGAARDLDVTRGTGRSTQGAREERLVREGTMGAGAGDGGAWRDGCNRIEAEGVRPGEK